MRRASLCALLLFSAAYAGAQNTGVQLLEKFTTALNSAKTLTVTYTVQPIGGSSTAYKLELAKPNLAKIDSPMQLIVADGANIVTYDKTKKTYFKKPETDQELKKLLAGNDFSLWAGFFDPKATDKYKSVRAAGTKTRKGVVYNVVVFNLPSGRPTTVTYYLDQTDFVAHQAEVSVNSGTTTDLFVFEAKSVKLGDKADPSYYTFNPPDGSRELTAAELNADKWYTNLDEALDAAKAANKMVFVFFEADW